VGFEPTVAFQARRFSRPVLDSRKSQEYRELGEQSTSTVPTVVPSLPDAVGFPPTTPTLDADLACVVAVWPNLPDALNAAVLAIVKTAACSGP
jgi:hypothetical protein